MNIRTIAGAALAAGMLLQAQSYAQAAVPGAISSIPPPPAAGPEALALENWHSFIRENPAPEKGCFHVSYPNFVWERADCAQTPPRAHPTHSRQVAETPEVAGNRYDYVVEAQSLISDAEGDFLANDALSVTSVGGSGATDGSNEYSVQLNTNTSPSASPSICARRGCTVWQQFVYGTDQDTVIPFFDVGAGLFMQYWLLGWNDSCPSGWQSYSNGGQTDCYMNSNMALLPDISISHLSEISMHAWAIPGSSDGVTLTYGNEAWSVSGDDSVLNISSVWREVEFNVFGDGGSSEADFNGGSSITVELSLGDESNAAPACIPPSDKSGTTGETNNLNLGTCQAGVPLWPARYPYTIDFTESLPPPPPPPPLCLPPATEIDGKCIPKGGLPQ
jgi:hypothetical protein